MDEIRIMITDQRVPGGWKHVLARVGRETYPLLMTGSNPRCKLK
jgi:hypothetical protein